MDTLIKEQYGVQTGGGIINDVIILYDGRTIVITDDAVFFYLTHRDYIDCNDPITTIIITE